MEDKRWVLVILMAVFVLGLYGAIIFEYSGKSINKTNLTKEQCITTIQAAPLHTQGSFIHFEGIVVSDSRHWSKVGVDDYRFPEEVREGYLTLIEEYVGHSTYLLWTENKAFEYPGQQLKFWGFTDNIALIEETTILFPMINTIE